MKRQMGVGLAAGFLLGGCFTYSVDEGWFFTPAPVATKATIESELKLDRQDRLETRGEFSKNISKVFPNFEDRLPANLTHFFVSLGGERIAMTRAAGANSSTEEPLIAYCGGQSGSRRSIGDYWVTKLLPWGEALLIDMPGYGDSTGRADLASLLAFQRDVPGYLDSLATSRPLILWGHSLGGPVCAALASASREVDGVVLETTAPNLTEMMRAKKPWFTPPGVQLELGKGLEIYDIPAALKDFHGPIMVLAAGKDQVFPVKLEREVADALKVQGHNVLYLEYASADHMNSSMNGRFVADAAASSRISAIAGARGSQRARQALERRYELTHRNGRGRSAGRSAERAGLFPDS
jgi:pimeloyl-ACP methyl ester carboxylesterase